MRIFLITVILLISSCSFDNKTGIWTNNKPEKEITDQRFKDFKQLLVKDEEFYKIIKPSKELKIELESQVTTQNWNEEHYNGLNNIENFGYSDLDELIFKSKKLSKYQISDSILFDGENIITTDVKGNLIFFSTSSQNFFKFNFYKKNFKKLEKKLRIIRENNIIFVADNIGYLYAYDYKKRILVWAKNYKIPFRSNFKISKNKIFIANQDNILNIIDKSNGQKLKTIPTEQVVLKNEFSNSLANNNKSLFYLNTFGSIYSINNKNLNLEWFVSLNQSSNKNFTSLFFAHPIIVHKKNLIVSTEPNLYILNSLNGSVIFKKPIRSRVKPIVSGNYLYTITKDNLLICIDLASKKIIYSISIGQQVAKYLKTKERTLSIRYLSIINSKLYIFLNNTFVVKFEPEGIISEISNMPDKIGVNPIFVKDSILSINRKNKLIIVN